VGPPKIQIDKSIIDTYRSLNFYQIIDFRKLSIYENYTFIVSKPSKLHFYPFISIGFAKTYCKKSINFNHLGVKYFKGTQA